MIAFTTAERAYLIHESDLAKLTIGSWYALFRRGVRWSDPLVQAKAIHKRTASVTLHDPGALIPEMKRGDELRKVER